MTDAGIFPIFQRDTTMRPLRPAMALVIAALTIGAFAPSVAAETVIRVSYGNQPGEPIDLAVRQWATWVEEESGGDLVLRPFPASQLGNETEITEQARFGSAVIGISAYSNFFDVAPDLSVIDAPYIADSFEAKARIFDSDWFQAQSAALVEQGYRIVVPWVAYGERQLLSNREVRTPEDLRGVRIRVQNSPMYVAALRSMNAVPTPMSLGDVYPALAQGMIDGVENPIPVLHGGRFEEVVKRLSLTRHMQTTAPFVTGEEFWQRLTPEQRRILSETGARMAEYANRLIEERSEADLERMRDAGVEIIEVDLAPFRSRAREMIPSAFPQWSDPGLFDLMLEITSNDQPRPEEDPS